MRFCIPYSTFGRSFSHFCIPYMVFERSFSLFCKSHHLYSRCWSVHVFGESSLFSRITILKSILPRAIFCIFLKKRKKRDNSIVTSRKNKEKNKKKNKNVNAIKTNRISFGQNDGFSKLDLARGECEKNGSRSWRMAIYDEPRWS